jgi:hypothetical protein
VVLWLCVSFVAQVRLLLCKLLGAIVARTAAIGSEALLMPYMHEFVMAIYVRATPG